MKFIILPIFLFLSCLPLKAHSQTTEKKIKDIRASYDVITKGIKDSIYKTKTITFECPDRPAYGHLTFYSEGSELKMIELSKDDGSHGGETEQFFIKDKDLIFYYEEGGSWTFEDGEDTIIVNNDTIYHPHTQDDLYETRYYFYKNEAIRCLGKHYVTHNSQTYNPGPDDTPNEPIDCDTKSVLDHFYKLVKLITVVIREGLCPKEIMEALND